MFATEEFRGTERFTLRRCLGSGSFGKVYEAFDQERKAWVALKVPHAFKAADLLRLKQEFRSLADISHPNLATLHELLTEGDRWFFTMELVEGRDFFTALREEDTGRSDSGPTLHPDGGTELPLRSDITLLPLPPDSGPDHVFSGGAFRFATTYPCSPPPRISRSSAGPWWIWSTAWVPCTRRGSSIGISSRAMCSSRPRGVW